MKRLITEKIWTFLFLSLIIYSPGVAQEGPKAFNLDQSISYALENNRKIEIARFDEYIANAQVKQLLAIGLPQIKGTGDMNYFVELPTSILPGSFNPKVDPNTGQPIIDPETGQPVPGDPLEVQFGTPWQVTGGIAMQQLIVDGTYFIGIKAARSFVELSQINTQRSREELAYEVSKAYYAALITVEKLNLLDANIGRLQKLYDETKVLNEEGFVEKIDVDRLQISLTNLQLERDKVASYGALAKDLLKFQMGMPVDQDITLTEASFDQTESPESLIQLNANPQERIEFSLIESQIALENLNRKRYLASFYPSLYGFGSYQWNAQRYEFDLLDRDQPWFPTTVVGLKLNVPIFDGARTYYQIQESKLKVKQLESQYVMLENAVLLENRKAQTELQNAYENLQVLEQNVSLAKKIFEVSEKKYKAGVGSSIELNQAETGLQEAESNYLNAAFEFLLAKIELQKASGAFSQYHE